MGTNVALLSYGIMWGCRACFATVPRQEQALGKINTREKKQGGDQDMILRPEAKHPL